MSSGRPKESKNKVIHSAGNSKAASGWISVTISQATVRQFNLVFLNYLKKIDTSNKSKVLILQGSNPTTTPTISQKPQNWSTHFFVCHIVS